MKKILGSFFAATLSLVLVFGILLSGADKAFAAVTPTSATLNGSGATITVAPGASISVVLNAQTTGSGTANDWNSTSWRISTTPPGSVTCIDTPDHSGAGNYSESFSVTAPLSNGTYNVYLIPYNGNGCASGVGSTLTLANRVIVAPPTPVTTVGDGTSPANKTVLPGNSNKAVSSFTLSTNIGTDTVTGLIVTGTNISNVAANGVKLYQDVNSNNEWDVGDTQVGAAASFSGTTATFSLLTIPVTTTSVKYLVTYDIAAGATNNATLTGFVSSVTATNAVTNSDTVDATLTIDSAGPTITQVTPVATPTNDATPNYGINSTETGTITYGGSCATIGGTTSAVVGNQTITLPLVSEGIHADCTVTVTDGAGNPSNILNIPSFTVDITPPSGASISYPDGFTDFPSVQVDFNAGSDPAGAGVNPASAQIWRRLATLNANGTCGAFPAAYTLVASNPTNPFFDNPTTDQRCYQYAFVVSDLAGNKGATTTSAAIVKLDQVAPVFTAAAPANNAFINNITTSSDLSYTLSENIMLGSIAMTRTGGEADPDVHVCTLVGTALASGAHTINMSDASNGCATPVTLVSGAIYTFDFDAADFAGGLAATVSRTNITFDNLAPTVTIEQSAGQNDPATTGPINFTVTFSESVTGFASGDIVNGGTEPGARTATVTGGPATYNVAVSGMTAIGTVTASINAGAATDAAGNTSAAATSADNSVTFDNGYRQPSTGAVISTSGNTITPNNAFSSDNAYVVFDASTDTVGYTNFNIPSIPVGAIINGIEVLIEGNRSVSRQAEIQLSWNGGVSSTTKNAIFASATDATITLGGAADTWGRAWAPTDFTNANFRLAVDANLATGNLNIDQIRIRVYFTPDNTAPTLSAVTPVPTATNDTTPNYTFNSTEAGTIIYGGSCASVTTSATTGNNTITFNALAEGTYSDCTIMVTDAAGNTSASLTVSAFTIDTTFPVTVIGIATDGNTATVALGATTASDSISVAFTADGTGSAISSSSCVLDGGTPTSCTSPFAQSGLSDGPHALAISSTDAAGNVENTAHFNWVVDTTGPSITLNGSASVNVVYGVGYVDEGATATDAHDGPISVVVSGDTVTAATPVGIYHIYYDAADAVGNTATQVVRTINVGQAPSVTTVSCPNPTETYTGDPIEPCTAEVSGAGLSLAVIPVYANNTNVGTASASYSYAGDLNHAASSDTENFDIVAATSVTAITCPAIVTYTGLAQAPCTATVTGVGGLNQSVAVIYTNNTEAGTASATANFAGDTNHAASSDTENFTIDQASSVTLVSCPVSVVFTGAAEEPCTVSVIGANGLNLTPSAVYANNTNVGSASASYTYAGDANHSGSSDSENFDITAASSVTTITCPATETYTGSAITPCTATVTGAGGLSESVSVVYTNNTDAGTANASATFVGDSNHSGSSDATTFTISQASSVTAITCPASQVYTGSIITPCTVSVTGAGGLSLTPDPVYTSNTNVGTASADYTYAGDANHSASSDSETFEITQASTVTTVTCPVSEVFTGDPIETCTAAVTGASLSLAVIPVYADNTNVGTASASYSYAGDANHSASSDTENFEITQANSVTSVTCPASEVFTGAPITPCTVSVTGVGGLNLTPAADYLNNTNAGSATASYTYAGDANHSGSSDTANFDIAAAVSVTTITCPANVTFTGVAQEPCSATVTGAGGLNQSVTVVYTDNTAAGTANATATFAGDSNHAGSSDSENFTIDQASSVTTVTCSASEVFTGVAIEPCSVSVTGIGGLLLTPNPVYANNINVGTASASYSFAGDANHSASSDTENFEITAASSLTVVTCPVSAEFTGLSLTPCSVSVTGTGGLNLTPDPVYADNTTVGTASAAYSFVGDANHSASSDTKNFNITAASSVTTITCPASVTFTGLAQEPCTATVTGPGELNQSVAVVYTNNVDAGTASATATFAGDSNHAGSSDSENFTIDQAGSVTTVTCPASVTFTGLALTPCTVSVTGANGLNLTPDADYSNNTNAGTATASYTFAGDANHSGSTDSENFDITTASSVTTITCPANVVFNNAAQTPCTATVVGDGGLNESVVVVYTDNTNVGIANATASFAGDSNHSASSDAMTFAITKATSVTTVTCPVSEVYTGNPIEPCTAEVTGAGLSLAVIPVYSDNTNVGTASASYTFGGDANHSGSSDTKNFNITAASAVVTLSDLAQFYNGTPRSVTVVTAPLGLTVDVTYDGLPTAPVNPGSYAVVATVNDANYSGSANDTLVITDNTAPVIAAHVDVTEEATSAAGAVVTYSTPTATDDVDATVIVTCTPPSGSTFPLGTTTVTCSATDSAENTATSQFNVVVIDTSIPVITLTGVDPQVIEVHGSYSELGATVTDNFDTGLIAIIDITALNLDVVGEYLVTYNAQDSNGNHAVQKTRTVKVVDTTVPVITAHADETVEATSAVGAVVTYTSPDVTDNLDAATAATCVPASGSTFAVGSTTVTCNHTDSNVNAAVATTFVVHVVDTTAPIITLNGATPINLSVGDTYSEQGATSTDAVDGELPAVVGGDTVNTSLPGTYVVSYSKTDAHGNPATPITRSVNVADTGAPVIEVHADVTAEATSASGAAVNYTNPTATDDVDGSVIVTCVPPSGSTFAIGTTTVTCSATDSAENTDTSNFNVVVVDTTGPETTIDLHPTDPTATTTTPFTFSANEPGSTFTCQLDSETPVPCVSGVTYLTLAQGAHTFAVFATDQRGNPDPTPATFTWTLDQTGPVITLLTPLPDDVVLPSGTVTFNSDDAVEVFCQVYRIGVGPTVIPCVPNGTFSYGPLVPGNYILIVSGPDALGNYGNVQRNFTIDEAAPVLSSESTASFTTTTATITWTTDHPATSRVVYDTVSHNPVVDPAPNYGYAQSTVEDANLVTSHSVTITGLTPNTTYYFRPVSHGSPEAYGIELSGTTTPEVINPTTGTITVTKVVVGGTKVVSDFPLFVDETAVTSGVSNVFAAGNHTIHETGDVDYVPSFSGSCVADADNTARIEQIHDWKAKKGALLQVIYENPGDPTNADKLNQISDINAKIVALLGSLSASVNVTAGDSFTCTITNTYVPATGALKVNKVAVNGNGTFSFAGPVNFVITTTEGSGSHTIEVVRPDTYTITEGTLPEGWSQTGNTCADVVVEAGKTVECTITNTYGPIVPPANGVLVVQKVVENNDVGTKVPSDFSFQIDGHAATFFNVSGENVHVISAGQHVVNEVSPNTDGYTMEFSGDCDANGNVSIMAGATSTCVIINTFTPVGPTVGSITIEKHTDGTDETFNFVATGTGVSNFDITTVNTKGEYTFTELAPGMYSILESAKSGWTQTGATCTNGENTDVDPASISLAPGDDVTCVFTNEKDEVEVPPTGKLVFIKKSVGGNGTFTFDLTQGDSTLNTFTLTTHHKFSVKVFKDLPVGEYAIEESDSADWTQIANSCESVTIEAGKTKVCFIKNKKYVPPPTTGKIVFIKKAVGNNGTFNFDLAHGTDGLTVDQSFSLTTHHGLAVKVIKDVVPGTYSVHEADQDRWGQIKNTCRNLTVTAGHTTYCTITNDYHASNGGDGDDGDDNDHDGDDDGDNDNEGGGNGAGGNATSTGALIVTKTTIGDNGTFSFSGTASFNITTVNGTGSHAITGLMPGVYSIVETTPVGWTQTSSTCENVAVSPNATSTCAIVNTKNATSTGNGGGSNEGNGNGNNGGNGGGGNGGLGGSGAIGNGPPIGSFGGGNGPIAGSVLGASTATLPELPAGCTALLNTYMRHGRSNNSDEVKKLQEFLNKELGEQLPITGFFGKKTDDAVRKFQKAHTPQVLTPWGITDPTGYVYKTTQRWVNLTHCSSLNIPMPILN